MWKRNTIHIDDVAIEVVEPGLEKRIVEQLEFYFGDANLPFDRFLLKEVAKDDGWVPVAVLLRFRKLAGLCRDAATVAAAVRDSPDGLLEVRPDDGRTSLAIRRKPDASAAAPDAKRCASDAAERSVCCDGFPTRVTMDELLSFGASVGDAVVTKVTPRKYGKTFRGTVYLSFVSRAEAQKFLDYGSVRYNGAELTRAWYGDYAKRLSASGKDSEFRRGRLIKADVVDDTVTHVDVKNFFADLGFGVPFVWIDHGQKEAWIRLTSERSAWDVLRTIANQNNAKVANFVVPDDSAEETVLNIMAKQCFSL